MQTELKASLVQNACDAALLIGQQLNLLLDAYDFYTARYPAQTKSDDIRMRDLEVSIKELGVLPHHVTAALNCWKVGEEVPLSKLGFEINVLNEFSLHMRAVMYFMTRAGIEMDQIESRAIGAAFSSLRTANRLLT